MRSWRRLLPLLLLPFVACGGDDDPVPTTVGTNVDDWRDRVVYELLVDRFDNGDRSNDLADGFPPVPGDLSRFQGGDWRGVAQRLDYLAGLGVSAIWISPVVQNVPSTEGEDGYHGYWASDFITPNPRFGTMQELADLVREAHARDIAVIVDVVTNHTGRVFDYDLDGDGAYEPGEIEPPFLADGPYDTPLLWYFDPPRLFASEAEDILTLGPEHFHRRGLGGMGEVARALSDFPTGLRDLSTEREDVLAALVATYAWWVRKTDVDGFRIDAVPHVEHAFWAPFCERLRARLAAMGKHRFLLLGEVFTSDPARLSSFTEAGMLDAVFDFSLKFDLIDGVILGGAPPADARGVLTTHRELYQDAPQPMGVELTPWQARVAFADNHDTWRLRAEVDDWFAVALALTVVFTVDAVPALYYGTELDFDGTNHHAARELLWESGFPTDGNTYRFIARLAALRRGSVALRYGSLELRYASEHGGRESEEDASMLAWERHHEGERVLVALNAHAAQSSRATVPTGFAPGTVLRDALEGSSIDTLVAEDGSVELELLPRSSVVLMPAE